MLGVPRDALSAWPPSGSAPVAERARATLRQLLQSYSYLPSHGGIVFQQGYLLPDDTLENLYHEEDMAARICDALPEDAWTGPMGFIHTILYQEYLKNHPAPEDVEYYLCGPPLMISAVTEMLLDLGVERSNILFDDFG